MSLHHSNGIIRILPWKTQARPGAGGAIRSISIFITTDNNIPIILWSNWRITKVCNPLYSLEQMSHNEGFNLLSTLFAHRHRVSCGNIIRWITKLEEAPAVPARFIGMMISSQCQINITGVHSSKLSSESWPQGKTRESGCADCYTLTFGARPLCNDERAHSIPTTDRNFAESRALQHRVLRLSFF